MSVDRRSRGEAMECPFPGPASYDYDGRHTFFGREEEIVTLTARLMGRELTVLTAGSGDGKTSLLHAGVVPMLYMGGIEAIVTEPGGQAPIAAIGQACLDRLAPSKAEGKALLERLIAALPPTDDRPDWKPTLEDARAHCDALGRHERQRLLLNNDIRRPVNLLAGGPLVTWLRDRRLSTSALDATMSATTLLDGREWPGVTVPLDDLRDYFDRPDVLPLPDNKLLGDPGEAIEWLVSAMDAAIKLRQAANPDFELVLIIDQFEEIFVQFRGGSKAADVPERWRHRDALITFLRRLQTQKWPLRIVLSLRKEHYADLEGALGDRDGLAPLSYHLGPLTGDQARMCLLRDDIWREGPPTPSQAQAIISGLIIEDHFVHPTLLSVVGEWLWYEPNFGDLTEEQLRVASAEAINRFVERAFNESGETASWGPAEQQEALYLLSQLIIRDGGQARRHSVARRVLLDARFVNSELRDRLLDDLQKRRLIRVELGLGGEYVEIVHERLIEAIDAYLEKLRGENENFTALPKFIDDLESEARKPICNPFEPGQAETLIASFERLSLPSVIAARTVGRLLLDPELGRRLSRVDDNGSDKADADAIQLRRAIVDLARRADEDDWPTLPPDPNERIEDGLLASPLEADGVIQDGRKAPPHDRRMQLMLASALIHRDEGATERIRTFATWLTRGRGA